MKTSICRLTEWFEAQCDGDWEHGESIRISTLDNPGWVVEISIAGTPLESRSVPDVVIERSSSDWMDCRMRDGKFSICCGVRNLEEAILMFLEWAEKPDGADCDTAAQQPSG